MLADIVFRCYNASQHMADWKQITARIRRARTSKDPAGQLSNLYEKTRDAMVAFELAKYFETSGQNADAAKWYSAAADRFRRADWKTKAQEAAVRLGAMTEPPRGIPEMAPLLAAVEKLGVDVFAIVEQDMYPCDPDQPLPIAVRTRRYLGSCGVPSVKF